MPEGFVDHGIPVKVSGVFSQATGVDASGRHHFYQARGQSPSPFFLLDTCLETGETRQVNADTSNACFPWGMCVASNGKVYVGTASGGHFFEYDPDSQTLKHLGRPGDESYLWTLAQGTDGKIYGGTYGRCKLIRYDPATGAMEDLGRMDPTERYVRTVVAGQDGFIYGGIGSARAGLVAYDIASATWTQLLPEGKRGPGWGRVHRSENGECYASSPLGAFRLIDGHAEPVDDEKVPAPAGLTFSDGRRVLFNDVEAGQLKVKSASGEETVVYRYHAENAGAMLFVVHTGPDGKLYGSSALPLRLFAHDPKIDASTELGQPTIAGGEIYSFVNFKGQLVMAAYPGCSMAIYDPGQPWELGTNPRRTPGLSRRVYRPHYMCVAPDGERVLICGLPDYGLLGGAISVFNPDTMEIEAEHLNIIPEQSITAICLTKEGLVAAGSSTSGGTGSHPTEKEAHFFLWDYGTRELVFDVVPVSSETTVQGLILGPDDRIYGLTAGGWLCVFDSALRQLAHVENLGYGAVPLNPMVVSDRDTILAVFRSHIVEITPGTFQHRVLGEYPGSIAAGVGLLEGRVYFCHGEHLMSFRLPWK